LTTAEKIDQVGGSMGAENMVLVGIVGVRRFARWMLQGHEKIVEIRFDRNEGRHLIEEIEADHGPVDELLHGADGVAFHAVVVAAHPPLDCLRDVSHVAFLFAFAKSKYEWMGIPIVCAVTCFQVSPSHLPFPFTERVPPFLRNILMPFLFLAVPFSSVRSKSTDSFVSGFSIFIHRPFDAKPILHSPLRIFVPASRAP